MGTDIHFVIERQDRDGSWQAVYSKAYAYLNTLSERGFTMPDPDSLAGLAMQASSAGYDVFAVLSRVRCDAEEGPQLMNRGMPRDLSDYTARNYQADGFLHSLGHGTLAELRAALALRDPETGQSAYCDSQDVPASADVLDEVSRMLDLVEVIATRAAEDRLVLIGPEYDANTYTRFPEMGLSAHTRLAAAAEAQARSASLTPVSPETVRLIVAYDN